MYNDHYQKKNIDNLTNIVVIQPSSFCNLNCKYCYVPNKQNKRFMSVDVLESILTHVFTSDQVAGGFRLVWHSGEPLALGIDFYIRAIEIIEQVNKKAKKYFNCIQTNGTLLNSQWVDFIKNNDISVSVSIDGPQEIHDSMRKTRTGKGSFNLTMKGVKILRENDVRLVGLCVISAASLGNGKEIAEFFVNEGFSSLGFIFEEPWGGNPTTSITEQMNVVGIGKSKQLFANFFSDVFDVWIKHKEQLEIREFRDLISAFHKIKMDNNAIICQEDVVPGKVLSFDVDGNFTTFSPQMIVGTNAQPEIFKIANIRDLGDLSELHTLPLHKNISKSVDDGMKMCRNECAYFSICGGGVPASKFYENGTFKSTETNECKFMKQLLSDTLIEKISNIPRHITREISPAAKKFKKSHSRILNNQKYVWNVERLWKMAECLPQESVRLDTIVEAEKDCWFADTKIPSIKNVAFHAKRIFDANLEYPIILNEDGSLMDGGHRVAKAILEGLNCISAVKFPQMPEPDYIEEIN